MTTLDWIIIFGYFCGLGALTTYVVRSSKDTSTDYFLAGRNLGWWVIGASIFASNIGSEHIVGLAGSGAQDGVALAHYELHAWCLLVLAWVFVPFYMRSLVFTMPEFLERRFSVESRYVLSIVSILTFIVSKIAVGIFAGGVVFAALLPELSVTIGGTTIDSFWIGSVLVIVLTGLYTALGGMRAVAYNDTVQVVVLICGSALLTFYGLYQLGGWDELRRICGSEMFNLWKPLVPAGVDGTWAPVKEPTRIAWYFNDHFPWLGMAICAPIIGLWYWCTDQYIVQRALGAPNETVARRGSIFAAFLKLFPPYLFIIPGLIAFALAKSGKNPGLADAFFGPNAAPNATQGAFPLMVEHLLPSGLRGIVVAGLLSALMGSLAGVFNACSTLFTVDLYQKWKPHATEHELVRTGRIATAVMVLIAMAWIPVIKGAHGLYNYLQAVQGYLAPPIFVVFFFGVFNKRLERPRLPVGADRRVRDRRLPTDRGYAGQPAAGRVRERLHLRVVPLGGEQHLLPVLQRADHADLADRDGGRELRDGAAVRSAADGADLRDDHARAASRIARELEHDRGGRIGGRRQRDHRRLPVFQRVDETGSGAAGASISCSTRPCEPEGVSTDSSVATVGARSFSATVAS